MKEMLLAPLEIIISVCAGIIVGTLLYPVLILHIIIAFYCSFTGIKPPENFNKLFSCKFTIRKLDDE